MAISSKELTQINNLLTDGEFYDRYGRLHVTGTAVSSLVSYDAWLADFERRVTATGRSPRLRCSSRSDHPASLREYAIAHQ